MDRQLRRPPRPLPPRKRWRIRREVDDDEDDVVIVGGGADEKQPGDG
jgi:hypothetical protein